MTLSYAMCPFCSASRIPGHPITTETFKDVPTPDGGVDKTIKHMMVGYECGTNREWVQTGCYITLTKPWDVGEKCNGGE
jgi:hypothetical protein